MEANVRHDGYWVVLAPHKRTLHRWIRVKLLLSTGTIAVLPVGEWINAGERYMFIAGRSIVNLN